VVGFTARLLIDDPKAPKYINTPATLLYDKSRHVFGLHLAKEAIRKNGYVVVVEGNLDVIASHQAGVRQVVATAGTAMTEQHLKMVSRLTNDVRLAYDQDNAGLQAAERTISIASKVDISLSIITVTGAKDPDELIQKNPNLWQQAIEKQQYALDWLIDRYKKQLDINSAQGKRQFTDILLKVVRGLNDPVEQDHYITVLGKLIGVSSDALRSKFKNSNNDYQPKIMHRKVNLVVNSVTDRELIKAQNHFLAIMLMQPGLRMYLKSLTDEILPERHAKTLFDFLKENTRFVFTDGTKVPPEASEYCQILVLLYEELYQSLELLELRYEAAQLQARLMQQYVQTKKTE
ncbi:MAG: toprim domain-containing protein, partial [Minisyncoccia bacterium]